jgi:hypothetical protein
MGEELVARDGEQVGAEARCAPEALAPLHAREEGTLREVGGVVRDLVRKEPVDRLEVSLEELVARRAVAPAPALEQIAVTGRLRLHHHAGPT